jgi:response regulator RpfG family c-di-GMP phosphodiesterase
VLVAAELHDVGKVAIPVAIINKPGPLDDDEWAFMRRHTLIGERIVAAAPALGAVAKLVRASHERWEGNGYPDAIRGEDIPLGARIVAVCDAYDAIVATALGAAPLRRWPSCAAAPVPSSTARWWTRSPPCSRPRTRPTRPPSAHAAR